MTPITAAVCVFWGVVVLAVVRMLLTYKRSSDTNAQVKALRDEVEALRIEPRLQSLEAGQLTLSNKLESNKVTQMRSRRGWGQ
jgi:hypothetical protein